MKLTMPDAPAMPIMPMHPPPHGGHLPGFCAQCRIQLLPPQYAFECKEKSDKHPNGYSICGRCGLRNKSLSNRKQRGGHHRAPYYQPYGPPPSNVYYAQPPNPYVIPNRRQSKSRVNVSGLNLPSNTNRTRFDRFLNTKNKTKHYEQVHQLINQASNSAINTLFDQISRMSMKQKRHLLHTMYDHFDINNVNKYDFINKDNESEDGDIDDILNENDLDSMAIGPSRMQNGAAPNGGHQHGKGSVMKNIKQNMVKDNAYNSNLIAGNINVNYKNDDDFILANAHLLEQQENALKRIRMQQFQQQQMAYLQARAAVQAAAPQSNVNGGVGNDNDNNKNNNNDILSLSAPNQDNDDDADNTQNENDNVNADKEEDDVKTNIDSAVIKNINDSNDQGLSLSSPSNPNETQPETIENTEAKEDDNPFLTQLDHDDNGDDNNQQQAEISAENENDNPFLSKVDNDNIEQQDDGDNDNNPFQDKQTEAIDVDNVVITEQVTSIKAEEMKSDNPHSTEDDNNSSQNKSHYNIEITQVEQVEEEKEEKDMTETEQLIYDDNALKQDIDNIVIDTDDDLDLTGIEFSTHHQHKPNSQTLQYPVNEMNDPAESSANEEEPDEKLEELEENINVNVNGNVDIISNPLEKYQFKYNNGFDNKQYEADDDDLESVDYAHMDKSGDLRMAELEELFGCTIGENLTDELGQDLWWYRVFIYLPKSQLKNIMLTCRYFYYMSIYHELVHDHIIRVSSIPALIWKLEILKDFNIENKFKKSMNYLVIKFIKHMDWKAIVNPTFVYGYELIKIPDTKQLFIEYSSINSKNLDEDPRFLKMTNLMFQKLFENMRSTQYVELINKTSPKKEFTWKLQSFNHIIPALNNVNRIKAPCWSQSLFNPKIYSLNDDMMNLNATRAIEYIYLTEMKFEHFTSLVPRDAGGVGAVDAANYFEKLTALKGAIMIFGEDTTKKTQEMQSVAEQVLSLLDLLKDSLQYLIIGVNRWESIIHCPFVQYDVEQEVALQHATEYTDEVNQLPMSYELYKFNYAFKLEIKKLFWQNFSNPTEQDKDLRKVEMIKEMEMIKERQAKLLQEQLKSQIAMSIQSQFAQPQLLQAMQAFDPQQLNQPPQQQQSHIIDDIPHGPTDNNQDDDDDNESEAEYLIEDEMDANGGGDKDNKEISFVNEDDLKEKKEDDDEDDDEKKTEQPLHELGKTLKKYKEDRRYRSNRNRSAFIVIYNTQIYVEDKLMDQGAFGGMERIPITVNAMGQWQCPFCTMFNDRFHQRCQMCRKKKTKYIPQEILIQQQQIEQEKQYRNMVDNFISSGWNCPMCGGANDDDLKNCKLCTFERPK